MTVVLLARLALVVYVIYSIAFYAEGHQARGSAALKVLNSVAEILILIVLVWVSFFL